MRPVDSLRFVSRVGTRLAVANSFQATAEDNATMRFGGMIGAAAAFLMMAASAQAADLHGGKSVKDDGGHDCCAQTNWRGLYIGVGAGIGTTLNEISVTTPLFPVSAAIDSFGGDGMFGTLQVGFDFHLSNRLVAGVFADYEFGSQEATIPVNVPGLVSGDLIKIEKSNAWSIGARIGAVAFNTLWYVPFGYTQADIDLTLNPVIGGGGVNNTHGGFFIGAGVETKLADKFGLKLEYRATQYDDKCLVCLPGLLDIKNEPREHSVRAVLTYKFDLGHRDRSEPMK